MCTVIKVNIQQQGTADKAVLSLFIICFLAINARVRYTVCDPCFSENVNHLRNTMSNTIEITSNTAAQEIRRLTGAHTRYVPQGFSIDLGHDTEEWDRAIRALGVRDACKLMADLVCAGYEKHYAKPFLFTEDCVAYEIKYHLDAFMLTQGYRGYHRNLAAAILPRPLITSRCREIDISANDARDLKQRFIFHYKKGIRGCYRNTSADPFSRKTSG